MGELLETRKLVVPSGEALAAVVQARARAEQASQSAIFTCLVVLAATLWGGNPQLALSGALDRSSQRLRDVALYIMNTRLSLSQGQLGQLTGAARNSVGRSIGRIETAREDGVFNWKLELMERLAEEALEGKA